MKPMLEVELTGQSSIGTTGNKAADGAASEALTRWLHH